MGTDKNMVFIRQAQSIHGIRYDYANVNYINVHTPVTIVCREHGEFEQTPNSHITKKSGCPFCAKNKRADSNRKTTQTFIKKANQIHHNKYDYSQVIYVSALNPVTIVCSVHGKFNQRAASHLSGRGCSLCGVSAAKKHITLTTKEFIDRAIKVHGDTYDYSDTNYTNAHSIVEVICGRHGVFLQRANDHLSGSGCRKCSYEKSKGGFSLERFQNEPELKARRGYFYICHITIGEESFVKVGITTRSTFKRYQYQNINLTTILETELDLYTAFVIEQNILQKFAKYKYVPKAKFNGYTECFHPDALESITTYISPMLYHNT